MDDFDQVALLGAEFAENPEPRASCCLTTRVRCQGNASRSSTLALNRKNALFAGSDDGGDHWAVIASMIETCKLGGINPQAWLSDTLTRLAAGHSATALDQLMPWNYATAVT